MLKTLSKTPISPPVSAVTLAAADRLWFKNGANFIYGAHANVVDHLVFAKPIEPTEITAVNLLSPRGQVMLADRTVVVEGGEIISVAVAGSMPANAEGINGRGQYIISGLVGSHAYILQGLNNLLLYLTAGDTSIGDLGGWQCTAFTTPLAVRA